MRNLFSKTALTAALALAITVTLTACEEKEAKTAEQQTAAEAQAPPAPTPAPAESKESISDDDRERTYTDKYEYDKQNRLVKITAPYGNQLFEYDEQSRIVKIYRNYGVKITYGITYISDSNVRVIETTENSGSNATDYVRNGNTITAGKETITIDKEGYIVKMGATEHRSESNYIYKNGNLIKVNFANDTDSYTYDNKKSPFSGSNTPKWLIQRLLQDYFASKNNVVDLNRDTEGYTSCTFKYEYNSNGFPIAYTMECEGGGA